MALLPKKLGAVGLTASAIDGSSLINAAPTQNKALSDFLTSISLKPTDLLIAFAVAVRVPQLPDLDLGIPVRRGRHGDAEGQVHQGESSMRSPAPR